MGLLDIDGRIALKWVLGKYAVRICMNFVEAVLKLRFPNIKTCLEREVREYLYRTVTWQLDLKLNVAR